MPKEIVGEGTEDHSEESEEDITELRAKLSELLTSPSEAFLKQKKSVATLVQDLEALDRHDSESEDESGQKEVQIENRAVEEENESPFGKPF